MLPLHLLRRREVVRVVITKLQEPLDPSTRVLRTLSIVPVRQTHYQTRPLQPFPLSTSNELIDDALRIVRKVTELRLPHGQAVWRNEGVPELEAEGTEFGEGGVADDEAGLGGVDVVEGHVLLLVLLVVDDGVTLGESSSLDILSGDTDVDLLRGERTEGESLGRGPVNVGALLDGLTTASQDTPEVLVRGEALGSSRDSFSDALQQLFFGTSRTSGECLLSKLLGRWESLPRRREPLLARRDVVLGAVSSGLEHAPHPLLVLLDVLLGERLAANKELGVLRQRSRLLLDRLVHPWLGEQRLVGFVVTVTTVADDIDDDVLLELSTVVRRELAHEVDGLDVVAVNVEDGCVDCLGDIRGVGSRAREARVGGEADLVVDDEVDGSSGSVPRQVVEAHGLVDNTLASERSVSMEQHTHSGIVLSLVVLEMLKSTSLAEHKRVLCLQMGRVGHERQRHLLARGRRADVVGAQMVLDITSRPLIRLRPHELVQNSLDRLPDDIREDVESASVRHSHGHVLDTVIDRSVDERFHTGDESLAALETKALLVGVLASDELLEGLGPDETVKNHALLLDGVVPWLRDLDACSDPVALLLVGNVDVLDTNGTACVSRQRMRGSVIEKRVNEAKNTDSRYVCTS